MKIVGFIAVLFCVMLALLLVVAYGVGTRLPVDHVSSVEAVIAAPPPVVSGYLRDIADEPKWRPGVHSVEMLAPVNGQDHWMEHLRRGPRIEFSVVSDSTISTAGTGTRVVRLHDPSYGGTWTYEVLAGPGPGSSTLRITEAGYVHPPLFRFAMVYVLGADRNLKQYLADLGHAVANHASAR